MSRAFTSQPVDAQLFEQCVELATRAPSAGKTQGWHLVVLTGSDTERYWNLALPKEKRQSFVFPHLLDAPTVVLVLADPNAYLERYSEPDKAATGLGTSTHDWPAPYWTIDASFATMTLLLALEDVGLAALFFAHAQEEQLRKEFLIPDHVQILGTIACGYAVDGAKRKGRSATRDRRSVTSVIHRNHW